MGNGINTLIAALTLAVALALGIGPAPLRAEPGPIGRWLMNQPVTLWDWGMFKAREDAKQAAKNIGMEGHGATTFSSTRYNWDTNEIIILFRVREFSAPVTHENCNVMRRAFIGSLTGGAHTSSLVEHSEWLVHWTVGDWFSHDGYKSKDRDEELEEKLAQIVFVETIIGKNNVGIICKDRIMAPEAPSKPWSLVQ